MDQGNYECEEEGAAMGHGPDKIDKVKGGGPPSWAPAHGYRDKHGAHHSKHSKHGGDGVNISNLAQLGGDDNTIDDARNTLGQLLNQPQQNITVNFPNGINWQDPQGETVSELPPQSIDYSLGNTEIDGVPKTIYNIDPNQQIQTSDPTQGGAGAGTGTSPGGIQNPAVQPATQGPTGVHDQTHANPTDSVQVVQNPDGTTVATIPNDPGAIPTNFLQTLKVANPSQLPQNVDAVEVPFSYNGQIFKFLVSPKTGEVLNTAEGPWFYNR